MTGLHLADSTGGLIPETVRLKLLEARAGRRRPLRDDKILTDWNGLAIAALARGGAALGEARYSRAAERAAGFLLSRLRFADGGLLHRYRDGEAAIEGFASDCAFLAWGLVELYGASFQAGHLCAAVELGGMLRERFVDATGARGATLSLISRDAEKLLVRPRSATDGAIPSPASVTAYALPRLARMTGRADLEEVAAGLLRALSVQMERHPPGVHVPALRPGLPPRGSGGCGHRIGVPRSRLQPADHRSGGGVAAPARLIRRPSRGIFVTGTI